MENGDGGANVLSHVVQEHNSENENAKGVITNFALNQIPWKDHVIQSRNAKGNGSLGVNGKIVHTPVERVFRRGSENVLALKNVVMENLLIGKHVIYRDVPY